jgi:DNA polymerase
MLDRKKIFAWLHQQRQLSMPDFVLSRGFSVKELQDVSRVEKADFTTAIKPAISQPKKTSISASSQSASSLLKGLPTVDQLGLKPAKEKPRAQSFVPDPALLALPKREALAELFRKGCANCHLHQKRKKFVFGSGNAEASIMVIGEAPGSEEDHQGLPFVGEAGQLLTKMLAAIGLDRNKDVFITNVLKCRPPENRNPETSEILSCIPLLLTQIAVIKPRAILILGRIAAHVLLGCTDSIAKLRSKVHDYNGIPLMVVYHPAALLRNAEYKKPAWEDLQKFKVLMESLGINGTAKQ